VGVGPFYRHHVLAVDGCGAAEVILEVEGQPSGLGWLPDGSMLVVSTKITAFYGVTPTAR
jgi:hypothetical protein